MKHFTLNCKEYLGVKVSDTAHCFQVIFSNILSFYVKPLDNRCQTLPKGNWQIVGLLSQIQEDEEKCAELVITLTAPNKSNGYMISEMDTEIYPTACEAFHSLQQYLKMWTVNPYGERAKTNNAYFNDVNNEIFLEWQEAQQHVSEYLIVEKIK